MQRDNPNLQPRKPVNTDTIGSASTPSLSSNLNQLVPELNNYPQHSSSIHKIATQLHSHYSPKEINISIKKIIEQLIDELKQQKVYEEYEQLSKNEKIKDYIDISYYIRRHFDSIQQGQSIKLFEQEFFKKYMFQSIGLYCMIHSSYTTNFKITKIITDFTLSMVAKYNIVPQKYLKSIFLMYSIIYDKHIKQPSFNEDQIKLLREEIDNFWENKDYPISYPFLLQKYFKQNNLKFDKELNSIQQQMCINFIPLLRIDNNQQMAWIVLLKFALTIKKDYYKRQQIKDGIENNSHFKQIIERKKFTPQEIQLIVKIALKIANFKIQRNSNLAFFLQWLLFRDKQSIKQSEKDDFLKIIYGKISVDIINTIAIYDKIYYSIVLFSQEIQLFTKSKLQTVPIGISARKQFTEINEIFQTFKSMKCHIPNLISTFKFKDINSNLQSIKSNLKGRLSLDQSHDDDFNDQFIKLQQKIVQLPPSSNKIQILNKQLEHILLRTFTRICFRYNQCLPQEIKIKLMMAFYNLQIQDFKYIHDHIKKHLSFIGFHQPS